MPTCVELFSGAGGLALGMKQAGFEHRLLVERDPRIVETLKRNGFVTALAADVRDVDFSSFASEGIDVVCGGPPCQPFSRGGLQKGADDRRNGWDLAVDVVSTIRPRAVLFENVASMMSSRHAPYVATITARLRAMGFHATWLKVQAADFGVPQKRSRALCVAFADASALARFERLFRDAPRVSSHRTVREVFARLGPPDGTNGHVVRGHARAYPGHTGSTLDAPSKTLVAGNNGVGGGMNSIVCADGTRRYYTIREAAALQTFPDTYQFDPTWSRAFVEIGNAVPPLLAAMLARLVEQALLAPPCATHAVPVGVQEHFPRRRPD